MDALVDGVELSFDDAPAELGVPDVGLAPHETHVRFPVTAPPARAAAVGAHIDALSESGGQNNVFRVVSLQREDHVVLKAENGFRGSLPLRAATVGSSIQPAGVGVAALLVLVVGAGAAGGLMMRLPGGRHP